MKKIITCFWFGICWRGSELQRDEGWHDEGKRYARRYLRGRAWTRWGKGSDEAAATQDVQRATL